MDSIVGVAVFVDFIDNILTLVIPVLFIKSSQVKSKILFVKNKHVHRYKQYKMKKIKMKSMVNTKITVRGLGGKPL